MTKTPSGQSCNAFMQDGRMHDTLKKEGLRARLILQVHDELLIEAPEDQAPRAAALLKDVMEHVTELKVPLLTEVKVGRSWYETK